MYNYAFFSRILAFVVLLAAIIASIATFQHFGLETRVTEQDNMMRRSGQQQIVIRNLLSDLAEYSQRDPSLVPLLQKNGVPLPPPGQPKPPARKK